MTESLFNASLFNQALFNGPNIITIPPHVVLFNTTTIRIRWNSVETANAYQFQVNLSPDFRGTNIETGTTNVTFTNFTDSGPNNTKRYWRWRHSINAGSSWSEWRGIGSYWLDTNAVSAVSVTLNKVRFINPDDTDDRPYIETFPIISLQPQIIERIRTRNRLGMLLSEYVTSKAIIIMNFIDMKFFRPEAMRIFRRFNEEIKTFFLAGYFDQEPDNPISNIWKVQFFEDPAYVSAVSTRSDILEGEIKFMEV
jgi:hypothetical protein